MSTSRLEAFSDGVIAVAITLLVLYISVPDPLTTKNLGHALAKQWPIYAAYVTSFITIGIIINMNNPCINFCASFKSAINIIIQFITKFLNLIQIFFQSVNGASNIRSNSIANRPGLILVTSKIEDKFIDLLKNIRKD